MYHKAIFQLIYFQSAEKSRDVACATFHNISIHTFTGIVSLIALLNKAKNEKDPVKISKLKSCSDQ